MEITEWMSSKNVTLTHLHQLKIAFLTEFIIDQSNITTRNGTGCPAASKVLPLANLNSLIVEPDGPNDTLTVNIDPTKLDVGMLNLSSMAKGLFPSPLNGSNIGDIATWWQNATEQDTKDTSEFLSAVVNKCAGNFCKSGFITIGNPDIVGIGMILAIVMLLVLTVAFSFLSFGPLMATVSRPSKKKRFSFREACIGTVDELFSAVFVFALAVIVSTFIFRYKTDTRFDALMANALSQLCATTVVMLAASYWAHNKQRPHATGSVFVVTVLTIAMFATHAPVANMHASAAELACGIGRGRISTIRGDPFDMKKFHFVPVGFGTFLLALFGACFHHPWVHSHRPTKEKGSLMLWRILWATAQSLPSVMGLIGLVIYTTYFLNTWEMMKETYGATFSKNIKNWGFGQLLAIFTWLPPLLSFVHLFWGGMEVSLEKRLPQGWKVVRVQNDSDGGNGEHMTRTRVRQVSGSDGETYSLLSWRNRKKPTNTTPQTNYHQFPMRSETGFSNAGLLNAQTENQSHQAAHQSPEVGYDSAQVLFQNPVAQVYQVQSPEVGYQDRSPEVGHQAQNHEDEYHVQSPEVQYPSQGYHSHYHYHNQNYQNSGYPDAEYPPTPADAPGYYRPNR